MNRGAHGRSEASRCPALAVSRSPSDLCPLSSPPRSYSSQHGDDLTLRRHHSTGAHHRLRQPPEQVLLRIPIFLEPQSFLSLGLEVWSRWPSLPVPMADLGSFGRRRQPTAAEVVGRLKDDGDFDALRRAIVRKVKDNEVLRNNIITEVKQSMVLSEDGSEKMKLKELSDAIFQDVGSKIMGQISDEVWSVLQSSETDIQGSVEAVFDRIMNPEQQKDTGPSPKKLKRNGKGEQVSPAKASTPVSVQVEDDDPEEPPGFGLSDLQRSSTVVKQDQPCDDGQNHAQVKPNGGELVGAASLGDADDEDPDVPPGFG